MKMTRRNFLSASALTLLSCQLAPAARADCLLSGLFHGADTALPPKPLTAKVVDANPFMGRSESNIHHDCYNTDSTDAVLPVGICPEVNVAMEKTNPNASPAIFFDNFDNPVSPFLGGLAIRDLDAEEVRTIGFFSRQARRRRLSHPKLLFLCGRAQPHRLPHQPQPCADASCHRRERYASAGF